MAKRKNISRKISQNRKFYNNKTQFNDIRQFVEDGPIIGCKPDVSCGQGFVWAGEPLCRCMPDGFDTPNVTIDPVDSINVSFGRPEDLIELHVYDNNDNLLFSEGEFAEYTTGKATDDGLISAINIEPDAILRNRGYLSGDYRLQLNVLRKKVLNTTSPSFVIKDISPSRRELKIAAPSTPNSVLDRAASIYISELESSIYFKQFELNFENDNLISGINLLLDRAPSKHELLIKLLNPLPSDYKISDRFFLVEMLSDPVSFNVSLKRDEIPPIGFDLQGPNFNLNVKLDNSIPSDFKTYNSILKYNVTSSYQNLLNRLENKEIPNIQYDYIRPISSSDDELDTPFHFENFVHFGSATERLKNFRYKLSLIELYNSQSNNLSSIPGASVNDSYVLTDKENILSKKTEVIKNFDGYERFLYFTSGTYAWPKSNNTPPYNLFPISSSEAKTWFGIENDGFDLHGGQILSASLYDKENPYNLEKLIPNHIIDNPNNNFYVSFTHMIGQHFDHIWTHIKHITEINNTHHKRGISKDLVYFQLKSLGLETYDQFENSDLIEYILGEGSGSNQYNASNFFSSSLNPSETVVTASNDGSIPKGDITKEIFKRLYHNAPYLLKTKGTERGIKALMACYGIPETILHVKEYGGPSADKSGFRTFKYPKTSKGLQIKGANFTQKLKFTHLPHNGTNLFGAGDIGARTVEFTLLIDRYGDLIDNAASGRNLILTDRNSFSNYSFFPDTAYSGSGRFQFQNLFGAKAALIDPAPYTSG